METFSLLYIIVFSVFLGIEIISNVPAILHTPLMSGANAISGVIVIGAILMMINVDPTDYFSLCVGGMAIFLGSINISGGFFVTAKMLRMFNSKNKKK